MYIDEQGRTAYLGQEALDGFTQGISRLLEDKKSGLRENRKLHYHTSFQDLPISVENRKNSVRSGTDPDGGEWRTKMKVPYGYIPGTEGADGDAVDCFVGPEEDAAYAYVVHANNPETGEFNEDKVMLGFDSAESAKQVFLQHYDDPRFFGGLDTIPMWKFRDHVWVKKRTSRKLVASLRESGVRTFLLAEHDASLQVPEEFFGEPNLGGQAHIFTSMKRSLLGHHQDIMVEPKVREQGVHWREPLALPREEARLQKQRGAVERGVKGMKWGIRSPKEVIEKAGGKYRGAIHHPTRDEDLHHFDDPVTGSTLAMYDREITDPEAVREHMRQSRAKFGIKEAQEHGVKGMKWGIRHERKDAHARNRANAVAQGKPARGKSLSTKQRELMHDPKTIMMMQTVNSASTSLENLASKQAQSGRTVSPHDSHSQAMAILQNLGWKAGGVIAGLVGMGTIYQGIATAMRSPTGQNLFLRTDANGRNSITTDRQGRHNLSAKAQRLSQRTRTSVRESRSPFELRLLSFLREARRQPRIYYARSLQRYDSVTEAGDKATLADYYPVSKIDFPRTRRHAELGMGYFHDKIDKAKEVVITPLRRNHVTAGVFSEARHAMKRGIPVRVLMRDGRLRTVKRLVMSKGKNPSGEYARIVLKVKRRRRK